MKFNNSLIITWESENMHYARYGFKGIKAASATSEQRAINNLKRKLKERYYPGDKFKY